MSINMGAAGRGRAFLAVPAEARNRAITSPLITLRITRNRAGPIRASS